MVGSLDAGRIAQERIVSRQDIVPQGGGLGRLGMSISRHQICLVLVCEGKQYVQQRFERLQSLQQILSDTNAVFGKPQIIAAACCMQTPCQIAADQFTQVIFNHEKQIFIARVIRAAAVVALAQYFQTSHDLLAVGSRQQLLAHQHQRVRKRKIKKCVQVMITLAKVNGPQHAAGKGRRGENIPFARNYLCAECIKIFHLTSKF